MPPVIPSRVHKLLQCTHEYWFCSLELFLHLSTSACPCSLILNLLTQRYVLYAAVGQVSEYAPLSWVNPSASMSMSPSHAAALGPGLDDVRAHEAAARIVQWAHWIHWIHWALDTGH